MAGVRRLESGGRKTEEDFGEGEEGMAEINMQVFRKG